MQAHLERAIITRLTRGTKNPAISYVTVEESDGTLEFSTQALSFDELSKVRLVPVSIDLTLVGSMYQNRLNLKAQNLSIKVPKAS